MGRPLRRKPRAERATVTGGRLCGYASGGVRVAYVLSDGTEKRSFLFLGQSVWVDGKVPGRLHSVPALGCRDLPWVSTDGTHGPVAWGRLFPNPEWPDDDDIPF